MKIKCRGRVDTHPTKLTALFCFLGHSLLLSQLSSAWRVTPHPPLASVIDTQFGCHFRSLAQPGWLRIISSPSSCPMFLSLHMPQGTETSSERSGKRRLSEPQSFWFRFRFKDLTLLRVPGPPNSYTEILASKVGAGYQEITRSWLGVVPLSE